MNNQPNYNDGNWHGWNGGECPVHPKSEVEVVYTYPNSTYGLFNVQGPAYIRRWEHDKDHNAIAFRVTKPYVEPRKPREIWLNEYHNGLGDCAHNSKEDAKRYKKPDVKQVRFIEVIEE